MPSLLPRDRHLLAGGGLEEMSEYWDDPAGGAEHPVWVERHKGGQKDLTKEVTKWGLER